MAEFRVPKLDAGNKIPVKYFPDDVGTPPEASTTVSGTVELATSEEALAGTDPNRVITPATLKAVTDTIEGGGGGGGANIVVLDEEEDATGLPDGTLVLRRTTTTAAPVFIQDTQPTVTGPFAWWDTSGGNLTLWIDDGT